MGPYTPPIPPREPEPTQPIEPRGQVMQEPSMQEPSMQEPSMPKPVIPPTPKTETAYFENPPKKHLGYLESYIYTDFRDTKSGTYSTAQRENLTTNPTEKPNSMNEDGELFDDSRKMKFGENIDLSEVSKKAQELPSQKKKEKWPTDALRNFLYNQDNSKFDSNDKYQDPTWLGFEIMFIADESPLFSFDGATDVNTVERFLNKYQEIPEMEERKEIYKRFKGQIMQYFATSTNNDTKVNMNKRHYVESIIGMEKFIKKIVNYEEDEIEIRLNEDISLRTQYMIDLYNNLVYDYKYKRTMIPENLLRFNMYIKIKDIRPIKMQNPNYDPDTNPNREVFIDSLDAGSTYVLYKLYDCNFDFSESQTHEGTIQISGWNTFGTGNMNNANFKIKYKSISKVFESTMVNDFEVVKLNSHNLEDLYVDYQNDDFLGTLFNNNDYKYRRDVNDGIQAPSKKPDEDRPFEKRNKFAALGSKKVDDFKKLGDKSIRSVSNGIKGKFSEVRGALITDLKKSITDALPWDRLGNVYSTNFRQMSLENFGKNLVSEAIDTAIDPNELMELTNVDMKAPTIDGGFNKPRTAFSKNDNYLGSVSDIAWNKTGGGLDKKEARQNKRN